MGGGFPLIYHLDDEDVLCACCGWCLVMKQKASGMVEDELGPVFLIGWIFNFSE